MVVDWLARQHGFSDWKAKSGALIADGRLATSKVILAKPQSFMNKSGLPTVEIARFYKIQPEDIFVFYDEIDLAAGKSGSSRVVAMAAIMVSVILIGIWARIIGGCASGWAGLNDPVMFTAGF